MKKLIIGSPGTGKTTYLRKKFGENMSENLFCSFTNSAIASLKEKGLDSSRTIHSLIFKELNLNPYDIITEDDFTEFCRKEGIRLNYGRSVLNKINNTVNSLEPPSRKLVGYEYDLYKAYNEFKEKIGKYDYNDILLMGIEYQAYPTHYRRLIVDEAQDLTRLQFRYIMSASEYVKETYFAGDPHQTIYDFMGADIKNLIGVEYDEIEKLKLTYRLRPNIIKLANKIIRNCKEYIDTNYLKSIHSSDARIEIVTDLTEIEIKTTEKTYVLFYTNYLIEKYSKIFDLLGYNYMLLTDIKIKNRSEKILNLFDFIHKYELGDDVGKIPAELTNYFSLYKGRAMLKLGYTINDIFRFFEDKYDLNNLTEKYKLWLKSKKKVNLFLGTLHSSKGLEADHVILVDHSTKNVRKGYLGEFRDMWIRAIYVGLTRAKKRFTLIRIHKPIASNYIRVVE